jgi:ribosomal protein L11 methyltransferase
MKDQTPAKFWLTAHIEIDPVLEEAVCDYLVGVMGASVEQTVDSKSPDLILNAFLKEETPNALAQQKQKDTLHGHLNELAEIFKVPAPIISWSHIEDQDWSSNWKVHFKPFSITQGLVIAPTWEEYTAAAGEQVIVMDPGMAFGTGHHATTSLSLDFIRETVRKDGQQKLLDVGTGTGILGMGAALFGASRVLGVDNDPEAVRAASENVLLNGLESEMTVSLEPLQDIQGTFDIIVANIIHDVLITMTDSFSHLLAHDGNLILSGILHGQQEDNIISVFTQCGLSLTGIKQKEEWTTLCFTKTALSPLET